MVDRLLAYTAVSELDLVHELLNSLDEDGLEREALARELVLEESLDVRRDDGRGAKREIRSLEDGR